MNDQAQPAKRLSLSQILELMLQRGSGDRSSVTLSRNARGDTQIEVVVRTSDEGSVLSASDALDEAVRLFDLARKRYPLLERDPPNGKP